MIDSLQASLEGEAKGRAEALRGKKKLEADIQELEVALDHASKVNKHKNTRVGGSLSDFRINKQASFR